ncbi:Tyrosine-protein phosphatase 3 [Kluyveromyces marxianus]
MESADSIRLGGQMHSPKYIQESPTFSKPVPKPFSLTMPAVLKEHQSSANNSFNSETSSVLSSSSTLVDEKIMQQQNLHLPDKRYSVDAITESSCAFQHVSSSPTVATSAAAAVSAGTADTAVTTPKSSMVSTPNPLSTHRSSASCTFANPRRIAMKCNSSPVIPIIRSKEMRFRNHKDCSLISSEQFHTLFNKIDNENEILIIFDTRPYVDYAKSHIASALHLSLPSTLLKRKNFNLERLIGNLPAPAKETLAEYLLGSSPDQKFNSTVVIYDNVSNQTDTSVSLACFGISSKILDHESQNHQKPSVYVLADGFDEFNKQFPQDVEIGPGDLLDPTCSSTDSIDSPQPLSATSPVQPHTKLFGRSQSHSASPLHQPPQLTSSRTFSGSPVSASSPLSSLFGFTLPTNLSNQQQPTFKLSQIEQDISDLDSYVKAVEINERSQRNSFLESERILRSFKFPTTDPSSDNPTTDYGDSRSINSPPPKRLFDTHSHKKSLSPSSSVDLTSSAYDTSKLTFQVKFDSLFNKFDSTEISKVIPPWFCKLMTTPKLQFISKFQRLEMLERKRLHRLLGSFSSATLLNGNGNSSSISSSTMSHANQNSCEEDDDSDENLQSITISSGVEFGTKNRYKDIFPYEHTRVKLSHYNLNSGKYGNSPGHSPTNSHDGSSPDVPQRNQEEEQEDIWNTYINANYLVNPYDEIKKTTTEPSPFKSVRYIATQAPLKDTISDFYTCILNNNVPLILTLTDEYENGVEKCCKFWADGTYDGIRVELLDEYSTLQCGKPVGKEMNPEEDMFASKFLKHLNLNQDSHKSSNSDIIIRRIQLTYNNGESKFQLLQLQIRDWPDLGTLLKPNEILQLINLKNFIIDKLFVQEVFNPDYITTVLVHCSAGCGRTGTLCAVDSVLSNLAKFKDNDSMDLSGNLSGSITPEVSPTTSKCSPLSNNKTSNNIQCNNHSIACNKLNFNSVFDPIATTVNQFRRQRISMVQNINQYLFIYDCLLFYFTLNLETSMVGGKRVSNWNRMTKENSKLDILSSFIEDKVNESRTF